MSNTSAAEVDVRLVAIDVDGTLLRPDRTVSSRVSQAIRRVADDLPIILASARPPRGLRALHETLGLTSPQLNYNGAMTWDRANSVVLSHSPVSASIAENLIEAARLIVPDVVVAVEHLDRWYTDRVDDRFVTETGRLFGPDHVGPLESFTALGATKLMFHALPARITELRARLEPAYVGRVTFVQTDADLLQMMRDGVGKWPTLVELAASLGVPPHQIMAIGDNENDVEMIAKCGLGVAMANGTMAARDAARWIAPSNVDDGVAVAIERFLLSAC